MPLKIFRFRWCNLSDSLAHTTVLLPEAVESVLAGIRPEQTDRLIVDATFGRGGHSRAILSALGPQQRLLAFDRDPQAVEVGRSWSDARFSIRHEAFSAMSDLPSGGVDGILMDLGVSSPQIDDPERGFSFRFEGPLDMRMDPTRGVSVAQWLETATVQSLTEVIRDYGEERFAVSIAKAIDARRQERGPITTTTELAQLVAGAVKTREAGQNPATRTFQAFRIYINAELEELQQALEASLRLMRPGARLAVISFHSLEDRIVKQFMNQHSRETVDRRSPAWMLGQGTQQALTDVVRIRPSAAEVAANPRSRSAVMRVATRTEALP
jgi:16S rRNA (cytosine1402-N4)-methyltransferase